MPALLDLVRNARADSSIAFRERVYARGEQGQLLRDVIALANASVIGRRFLFLGVDDRPDREREFPGVPRRHWQEFCAGAADYLANTVEPRLKLAFESVLADGALVGAICLEHCDDPPYLLARRAGPSLPAGGGWIRSGVRQPRLLRRHLQKIFAARFKSDEPGEVHVGFPGELPREELVLPILPLTELPSALAAGNIERMLNARRIAKSVLGRSDSRIARLVHQQVTGGALPYRDCGTRTMRMMLSDVPLENHAADEHYRFELRAHRLNLVLSNLGQRALHDLILTLKIPHQEGVGVADRVYPAPGTAAPRRLMYPKVDENARFTVVQASGIHVPARGMAEAFFEPLRLLLREPAVGKTVRIAYLLEGAALERAVRGRLKIYTTG